LGDNLVAAPALRCLRQAYPQARIVLVSELAPGGKGCWAQQVFGPSGLVDEVIPFAAYNARSRWTQIFATLKLYRTLQTTTWGLGVALDLEDKVNWEPAILKIIGAETILTPRFNGTNPRDSDARRLSASHVADKLIDILRPLCLPLPSPGQGALQVNITTQEVSEVNAWLQRTGAVNAPKPWIAFGPWSNMQAKQWPVGRFTDLALRLKRMVGGTPFVFGGVQEESKTRDLIQSWGFGVPAAGFLNVRQGIALLQRCQLYVGNDSGPMHMAASAGIRCVAIFSSRDKPRLWEPYGNGHIVFRREVACQGCMLHECVSRHNYCINDISVKEAVEACISILDESDIISVRLNPKGEN